VSHPWAGVEGLPAGGPYILIVSTGRLYQILSGMFIISPGVSALLALPSRPVPSSPPHRLSSPFLFPLPRKHFSALPLPFLPSSPLTQSLPFPLLHVSSCLSLLPPAFPFCLHLFNPSLSFLFHFLSFSTSASFLI
jgi:hypothetical protein